MKNLPYVILVLSLCSCSDDEIAIDKNQLTLGTWYYEFNENELTVGKSVTLTFLVDGSYRRDLVLKAATPSGLNTTTTTGTWVFEADDMIDLTGYGTCVSLEGGPPCVPPDVDLKLIKLTAETLEVEEWREGVAVGNTVYTNIKP
jgi:hypothetical protein